MKVLAIVLLCAVAAVQGRSAGVQSSQAAEPAPGDGSHVVHLRRAIGTSGLLQTGLGTLISNTHILTTASNVFDSRFIWIRFGALNVLNPELVLESNAVTRSPDGIIALINTNRNIEFTPRVSPVFGFGGIINQNELFCGYGEDESGQPGEKRSCFGVTLERRNEGLYCGSSTQAPIGQFDIGAPIVSERRQTALLIETDGKGGGCFQAINEEMISWVEGVTGLDFSQPEPEA